MCEINIFNNQINIFNINHSTQSEVLNIQSQIQKEYDRLKRNDDQKIYDEKDRGKAINEIALNLNNLFKILFPSFYINDMSSKGKELKEIIDSALGFLKEVKKYFDNKQILEETFDAFCKDVLQMINTSGGYYANNLGKLIEEVIIFEIFTKYDLERNVYSHLIDAIKVYGPYNRETYFNEVILEKYHKNNYSKILGMVKSRNNFSLDNHKLYLDSIIKYYEILNTDFVIDNLVIEYKILDI
ncbi:hypothetical protein [Aliarcobacter butzleri]|uniref:hypothetical protein n=1 Tax=Aliarcobacter butzleri TaxID=28197 RepID=UPI00344EB9D2